MWTIIVLIYVIIVYIEAKVMLDIKDNYIGALYIMFCLATNILWIDALERFYKWFDSKLK